MYIFWRGIHSDWNSLEMKIVVYRIDRLHKVRKLYSQTYSSSTVTQIQRKYEVALSPSKIIFITWSIKAASLALPPRKLGEITTNFETYADKINIKPNITKRHKRKHVDTSSYVPDARATHVGDRARNEDAAKLSTY